MNTPTIHTMNIEYIMHIIQLYWILFGLVTPVYFAKTPATPVKKLCVKCKYFQDSPIDSKYGSCLLFPTETILEYELVVGTSNKDILYKYCTIVRSDSNMCGPEGRHFKRKYTPKKIPPSK